MASQQLVTVHKWEGENGSQWFALRRSGEKDKDKNQEGNGLEVYQDQTGAWRTISFVYFMHL